MISGKVDRSLWGLSEWRQLEAWVVFFSVWLWWNCKCISLDALPLGQGTSRPIFFHLVDLPYALIYTSLLTSLSQRTFLTHVAVHILDLNCLSGGFFFLRHTMPAIQHRFRTAFNIALHHHFRRVLTIVDNYFWILHRFRVVCMTVAFFFVNFWYFYQLYAVILVDWLFLEVGLHFELLVRDHNIC